MKRKVDALVQHCI